MTSDVFKWQNINQEIENLVLEMQRSLMEKDQKNRECEEKLGVLERDFIFNLDLIAERDENLKLQDREIAQLMRTLSEVEALKKERDEGQRNLSALRLAAEAQAVDHREIVRKIHREAQGKLDEKDGFLKELRLEMDREKMQLAAERALLQEKLAAERSALRKDLDQMEKRHELETQALQSGHHQQTLALAEREAGLKTALAIAEEARARVERELGELAEKLRVSQESILELKQQLNEAARHASEKELEWEKQIQLKDGLLSSLSRDWQLEKQQLEQELELSHKLTSQSLEWQVGQLNAKLLSATNMSDGEAAEKERLKTDMLNITLDFRSQLEDKNAAISQLEKTVAELKSDHERRTKESSREVSRAMEQLRAAEEQRLDCEKESNRYKELVQSLRSELDQLRRDDTQLEERMTQGLSRC
ncbi:hypothetical protein HDU91_007384 [Kappamyces sp. JEL0680]|nr:hypothetical protein HDU91_007384 [Kappamyces sp. JEL0680]